MMKALIRSIVLIGTIASTLQCRASLPADQDELARLVGSDDLAIQGPAARKLEQLHGEAALLAVMKSGDPRIWWTH